MELTEAFKDIMTPYQEQGLTALFVSAYNDEYISEAEHHAETFPNISSMPMSHSLKKQGMLFDKTQLVIRDQRI